MAEVVATLSQQLENHLNVEDHGKYVVENIESIRESITLQVVNNGHGNCVRTDAEHDRVVEPRILCDFCEQDLMTFGLRQCLHKILAKANLLYLDPLLLFACYKTIAHLFVLLNLVEVVNNHTDK